MPNTCLHIYTYGKHTQGYVLLHEPDRLNSSIHSAAVSERNIESCAGMRQECVQIVSEHGRQTLLNMWIQQHAQQQTIEMQHVAMKCGQAAAVTAVTQTVLAQRVKSDQVCRNRHVIRQCRQQQMDTDA